jgi:hypothetical protein
VAFFLTSNSQIYPRNPNGKTNIQLALTKLFIIQQCAGYRLSSSSSCSTWKSRQHFLHSQPKNPSSFVGKWYIGGWLSWGIAGRSSPQPFNFPKLVSPLLSFLLLHWRRSLMFFLFFKYMIFLKKKYFSLQLYISYACLMI